MVLPSIRSELLEEMGKLAGEDQRRVLDFARALARTQLQGTPGRELLRFSGVISSEDADHMNAVIEEECERIDPDGW